MVCGWVWNARRSWWLGTGPNIESNFEYDMEVLCYHVLGLVLFALTLWWTLSMSVQLVGYGVVEFVGMTLRWMLPVP